MSADPGLMATLFPEADFSLIAVVLGMPLLGAAVNGIWGKRLGKEAVRLMALTAVGVSFLAAVVTFLDLGSVGVDAHERRTLCLGHSYCSQVQRGRAL